MDLPIKLSNIKKFSQGRRSVIYTAIYKSKKVAIKVQKENIEAKDRILNEAKYLKILNKHKIGPKLIASKNNTLVYEFVKGISLPEFLRSKKNKKLVLKRILKQCRILDKLKINKLEFTRPIKHIFIDKNPVMIDFEKCYKTKNPKNVTQFFSFLINSKLVSKNSIGSLKKYKSNQTDKNFRELLRFL